MLKASQAGSFLYSINVSYHEFGIIKDNEKRKVFDYFKCDSLTQEQREQILQANKYVKFKTSSPQYAPEIKKVLICFPTKYYLSNKG
jgi:hypothetical protein